MIFWFWLTVACAQALFTGAVAEWRNDYLCGSNTSLRPVLLMLSAVILTGICLWISPYSLTLGS